MVHIATSSPCCSAPHDHAVTGERPGIDHHPLPLYPRRCFCGSLLPILVSVVVVVVVVEEPAATAAVVETTTVRKTKVG